MTLVGPEGLHVVASAYWEAVYNLPRHGLRDEQLPVLSLEGGMTFCLSEQMRKSILLSYRIEII